MSETRPRVLIVDDEESVLVTMKAILEMDGYATEAVLTGTEAVTRLRAGEYDLVLTDLRLGDMNGQEVLAEVHRRSPETVAIVLTGYASLESAIGSLREGAYDYLIKPCDVEELRSTVRRGLERRALGQQLRERVSDLERANRRIEEMNAELEARVLEATAELRTAVESLKELDQLKSQFISIASHELRTPITSMRGFVQIALRGLRRREAGGAPTASDWQRENAALIQQLEVAERQTLRLGRLVDELLDVSRIQAGRLEFSLGQVDLGRLVSEVVAPLQVRSTAHSISTRVNGDDVAVWGDADRLEQVVTNLVENAIKYSPEGGRVEAEVSSGPDEVRVVVADQGVGIPAEQLERIFDPFYRFESGTATHVGGIGLGLYISRSIVERHGGRIWAESDGKGSHFHVVLPRQAQPGVDVAADPRTKVGVSGR